MNVWTAIYRLSTIWKSDLPDEIKKDFFQAVIVSILQHGCTTCMQTKHIEKWLKRELDKKAMSYFKQILETTPHKKTAVLPLTSHLKDHSSKMNKTCGTLLKKKEWTTTEVWKKLISDVLLCTPTHGHASVGWPARTYIHQLCVNTGCSLENLLGVMDDRDRWRERERIREISAFGTTWWWW